MYNTILNERLYTLVDSNLSVSGMNAISHNVLQNLQIILQKVSNDFDLKTKSDIHQKIISMYMQQKFVYYFSDLYEECVRLEKLDKLYPVK